MIIKENIFVNFQAVQLCGRTVYPILYTAINKRMDYKLNPKSIYCVFVAENKVYITRYYTAEIYFLNWWYRYKKSELQEYVCNFKTIEEFFDKFNIHLLSHNNIFISGASVSGGYSLFAEF